MSRIHPIGRLTPSLFRNSKCPEGSKNSPRKNHKILFQPLPAHFEPFELFTARSRHERNKTNPFLLSKRRRMFTNIIRKQWTNARLLDEAMKKTAGKRERDTEKHQNAVVAHVMTTGALLAMRSTVIRLGVVGMFVDFVFFVCWRRRRRRRPQLILSMQTGKLPSRWFLLREQTQTEIQWCTQWMSEWVLCVLQLVAMIVFRIHFWVRDNCANEWS